MKETIVECLKFAGWVAACVFVLWWFIYEDGPCKSTRVMFQQDSMSTSQPHGFYYKVCNR